LVKVWPPTPRKHDVFCLAMMVVAPELYGDGQPGGRHDYWIDPGDDLGLFFSDRIVDLVKKYLHPTTQNDHSSLDE
jgi:hypothetical protein